MVEKASDLGRELRSFRFNARRPQRGKVRVSTPGCPKRLRLSSCQSVIPSVSVGLLIVILIVLSSVKREDEAPKENEDPGPNARNGAKGRRKSPHLFPKWETEDASSAEDCP